MSLRQRLYSPATRVLPSTFFEKRQARQAHDDFRNAGISFIHVPRTAGASVMRTIYRSQAIRHFTIDQFLNLSATEILALPRFAVVRNPWDRAVSAYHFARQGGAAGGGQILYPERYRGPAFATFETFVERYLATHDVWKLDNVFRPQSYFLGRSREGKLDHIGHFDRLIETEAWLSDILSRDIRLTHDNATDRGPYEAYYSDRTRRIVGEVYRVDIERFGFEFDPPARRPASEYLNRRTG